MNFIRQQLRGTGLRWRNIALIFAALTACCGVLWRVLTIKDTGPSWRGITVGRSTLDDVVAILGAPTSIEQEPEQSIYRYKEGEWGEHRIVIHDRVVEYIVEDTLAYPYDTFLEQLVDQYGTPDYVMWSGRLPGDRIVIFLNDGVFAEAASFPLGEARVEYIFYYRPRSLARLLVDFRNEISLVNPFPDSDVIGPRDPWFGRH